MSRAALHITRSQVNQWLLIQVSATLIAALIFLILKGLLFAKSIFLGGLVCILPQWIFARMWLAYYKASAAPKIVKMFYIGEVIKLLLTGILFVLALKYLSLNPVGFLSGFIVAQIAFWMAPLLSLWLQRTKVQK